MPKQLSSEDEKKVRAARFWLEKQKDNSLPLTKMLVVHFELKQFDDRIRQLAAGALAEPVSKIPDAPPLAAVPEAPPLDKDTIDEYTKIGKAKKVGDAIVEAAKYANMKDGRLTPSMIRESMKEPRRIVKDAGSWKEVKKSYLERGEMMERLLQFRVNEVGRIYKQVIDQMWKDNAPKRAAYERGDSSVSKNDVFQLNDLQFTMAGSKDPTSDYDVTFDHNVEKPWVGTMAVEIFNQKFRAEWEKEAGTVFDTNVYTQGFMPSDMSNIPTDVEKSINDRIDKVSKMMKEEDKNGELAAIKTRLEQQAKTAARVRETMAQTAIDNRNKKRIMDSESQRKVFQIEDLMSLVKIRKFMDELEWSEYSDLLLEGLPDGPAKETAASVLKQADATFLKLDEQLQARIKKLAEGREKVDQADLELEASNRLYEEYLKQAGAIVAANKGVLQGAAVSDWSQTQSTALFFANEAYHTSGPVESTVIGQQMGISVRQGAQQHLQAVNEQTGFVIEQHESAHDENGSFNHGRFLWKSAKYVSRICVILDQVKRDIGKDALTVPPDAKRLRELSKALLVIKKDSKTTEAIKDAQSLKAWENAGGGDIREMVLELNADVNRQLRGVTAK